MTDPYDLLEQLAFGRDDEHLDQGVDPDADELLERIMSGDRSASPTPVRRIWRRRTGYVFGAIAIIGVGAGAAAARWLTSSPRTVSQVACYSQAAQEPELQVAVAPKQGVTATQLCTTFWQDGTLGTSVPDLAECVTRGGIVAVIPGSDQDCSAVGLAVADPGGTAAEQVTGLAETIRQSFEGRCASPAEATSLIQSAFQRSGSTGWSIEIGTPLDSIRKCAAPAIDEERRVVTITGVPG